MFPFHRIKGSESPQYTCLSADSIFQHSYITHFLWTDIKVNLMCLHLRTGLENCSVRSLNLYRRHYKNPAPSGQYFPLNNNVLDISGLHCESNERLHWFKFSHAAWLGFTRFRSAVDCSRGAEPLFCRTWNPKILTWFWSTQLKLLDHISLINHNIVTQWIRLYLTTTACNHICAVQSQM